MKGALARILKERDLLHSRLGTVVIACAAVDDVTGWCVLAYIVLLIRTSAMQKSIWLTVGGLIAFVLVMIFGVQRFLADSNPFIGKRNGLSENAMPKNVRGEICVMDNACPHLGASLGKATVRDGKVVCPRHGWPFDPIFFEDSDGPLAVYRVIRASAVNIGLPFHDRSVSRETAELRYGNAGQNPPILSSSGRQPSRPRANTCCFFWRNSAVLFRSSWAKEFGHRKFLFPSVATR